MGFYDEQSESNLFPKKMGPDTALGILRVSGPLFAYKFSVQAGKILLHSTGTSDRIKPGSCSRAIIAVDQHMRL
jgi:hypothetical protein